MLSDILPAVAGDLAALVLLDLSAAFNIDESILLQRLQLTFCIDDTAYR